MRVGAPPRIIRPADESGDRWRKLREREAREESPDSELPPQGERLRKALWRKRLGVNPRRELKIRATRLVTPGGCARKGAATESATENRPPVRNAPLRRIEGKPCEPPQSAVRMARVKRWGKSPPPGWQRSGHGKPRVEQGQIGGEGWPGPMQRFRKKPLRRPSGRLLESRSDSGPRRMIAGARFGCSCGFGREAFGSALQNPAYRFIRQIFRVFARPRNQDFRAPDLMRSWNSGSSRRHARSSSRATYSGLRNPASTERRNIARASGFIFRTP